MVKRISVVLAAALLAFAQKDEPRKLRAWFRDGTGVEFEQETTGSTALALHGGGVAVSDAGIERIVPDKDGNILFAYFVEAWADPQSGTVTIRVKPLDKEAEADLHIHHIPDWRTPGPVATVAAVREFPGLRRARRSNWRFSTIRRPARRSMTYCGPPPMRLRGYRRRRCGPGGRRVFLPRDRSSREWPKDYRARRMVDWRRRAPLCAGPRGVFSFHLPAEDLPGIRPRRLYRQAQSGVCD